MNIFVVSRDTLLESIIHDDCQLLFVSLDHMEMEGNRKYTMMKFSMFTKEI